MKITILEGSRGTSKSTIASKLRQMLSETTLINFTGFPTDGEEGLRKVSSYYDNWMRFLHTMRKHDSNFVFDRFYFSEMVYSKLYKEYDFSNPYSDYNETLEYLASMGVEIDIILLTLDDEKELEKRLIRDKVPFANVEESAKESMRQQDEYKRVIDCLIDENYEENLKIHTIDTGGKSIDEVYDEVLGKIKDR